MTASQAHCEVIIHTRKILEYESGVSYSPFRYSRELECAFLVYESCCRGCRGCHGRRIYVAPHCAFHIQYSNVQVASSNIRKVSSLLIGTWSYVPIEWLGANYSRNPHFLVPRRFFSIVQRENCVESEEWQYAWQGFGRGKQWKLTWILNSKRWFVPCS